MCHAVSWIRWSAAVAGVMASPITLSLLVPAMIGLIFDVADLASQRLFVLSLSGALGLHPLCLLARRAPMPSRVGVAASA